MGCTIYAASPKALPADEAPGQDRYYPLAQYRHLHGNCSQRIAARWVRGFTRGGWVAEAGESATWSEALTTTQPFLFQTSAVFLVASDSCIEVQK